MKGTSTTDRSTLPLSALRLSPRNVRRVKPSSIEVMAASIRTLGVIQNLVAIPDPENPGSFEVIVGGRRLRALQLLAEQGHVPADHPVPCDVREDTDTTAVSLAENVHREAMHPADEFDACQALTSEGKTIDQIADVLGVTPLVVERRLCLAAAAPELLELFRADELTTDQLIALCATEDHERQLQVWNASKNVQWMTSPQSLRRAVLAESEIEVSREPRIGFIGGLDAYRAAGGNVRRDLFTGDGNGGFITDVALLDKLVADRLEATAAEVRAEGWAWVELWPEFEWNAYHRLGRAPKSEGPLPDELRAKVEALEEEAEKLAAEEQAMEADDGEYSEQDSERLDVIWDRQREIEDEIEDIKDAHSVYTPEVLAHAGAVVALDGGKLRIERGMVKAEDRKALAKEAGAEVEGGRETKSAGRKDNALSDALRRSLLGRRNHAAQLATARNPRVAKVLLALQMAQLVTERGGGFRYGDAPVPCDLSLREGYGGTRTHHPVQGEDAAELHKQFQAEFEATCGKLPKKQTELWGALAGKSDAELDAIIAFGVAASVSLAPDHKGLTGSLLDALSFDVAEHVTPTADNYFGRVSKPLILEALKESGVEHEPEQLVKLKKGELATKAEALTAGSRWVPKLIRTPAPKAAKAATPAKAKPAAKKPAAKKTAAKPAAKKAAASGKSTKTKG